MGHVEWKDLGSKDIFLLGFFFLINPIFSLQMFDYMGVYVLHVCLLFTEARRECQIPENWSILFPKDSSLFFPLKTPVNQSQRFGLRVKHSVQDLPLTT